VPRDHPLRRVREMTDRALQELSCWFEQLYGQTGRPSDSARTVAAGADFAGPVHHPQRATVDGSDRRQLAPNRWFVGLKVDDAVWDVTVFTKNRGNRLLRGEVSQKFSSGCGRRPKPRVYWMRALTVDGTLLEAWASRDSFAPKPNPPQRGNCCATCIESKTDPEARLY